MSSNNTWSGIFSFYQSYRYLASCVNKQRSKEGVCGKDVLTSFTTDCVYNTSWICTLLLTVSFYNEDTVDSDPTCFEQIQCKGKTWESAIDGAVVGVDILLPQLLHRLCSLITGAWLPVSLSNILYSLPLVFVYWQSKIISEEPCSSGESEDIQCSLSCVFITNKKEINFDFFLNFSGFNFFPFRRLWD